jgi:hypothetical protein
VTTPFDRVRRWVLLGGSRLRVTAALLVVVYLLVGPVGHAFLDAGSARGHAATFVPLVTTFLSGDFLLVSIVVSLNSVFTSQEQAPLGRQLDRIEAAGEFRREIESLVDEPISPAEPARFLQLLTGAILSEAQALSVDVDADVDGDAAVAGRVDEFTGELGRQTRRVNERLGETEGPTSLGLVLATLDYDYSGLSTDLRRLRGEHGEALEDAELARVERMLDLLRHFVTAREYFKTLYLSHEFATLSSRLLYLSLPVIVLSGFVLLHDGVAVVHDATTLVVVLALSPFFLLAAYTVRVATVTRRTRAAGQFVVSERTAERER